MSHSVECDFSLKCTFLLFLKDSWTILHYPMIKNKTKLEKS